MIRLFYNFHVDESLKSILLINKISIQQKDNIQESYILLIIRMTPV